MRPPTNPTVQPAIVVKRHSHPFLETIWDWILERVWKER